MNFNIPSASLHHVALSVRNYEVSRDFYVKSFGMTCINEWEFSGKKLCFLDIGNGSYLELHSLPIGAEPTDGRYLHFCLHTSNIEFAYNTAVKNGAEPNRAPFDFYINSTPNPMPVRVAWLYGPDNEQIELFQHLG